MVSHEEPQSFTPLAFVSQPLFVPRRYHDAVFVPTKILESDHGMGSISNLEDPGNH